MQFYYILNQTVVKIFDYLNPKRMQTTRYFFSYNKKLPLSVRSVFFPFFKEKIWGWQGHVVDVLALFATIFGIATSLGIGAEQSMAGINYLFGFELNSKNIILGES